MLLQETGMTRQEVKDTVDKYMIGIGERFDLVAERGKDMYVYDADGKGLDIAKHCSTQILSKAHGGLCTIFCTETSCQKTKQCCDNHTHTHDIDMPCVAHIDTVVDD